jgi:replicative DNA helicase
MTGTTTDGGGQGGRRRQVDPMVFLEEVQEALFHHLPDAFPDFGWVRGGRGWTATAGDFTRTKFGARPDRVVCHIPSGFLVHGGTSQSWLAYVNGGTAPRGAAFFDALRRLAVLAGADASVLDREPTPEELARHEQRGRRRALLEVFLEQAQGVLGGREGEPGRAYLVGRRGFTEESLGRQDFGFYPTRDEARRWLVEAGFTAAEIESSGLVADRRWEGRIVHPWRDHQGNLANIWARDITGMAEDHEKYLYLKGAPKGDLVAFGLDAALRAETGRQDLVLVEGLMDVILLRDRGFPAVVALGGDGKQLTAERWEGLAKLGVKSVTLAFDNDRKEDGRRPGWEGTLATLDNLRRAKSTPAVFVLDPAELGDAKDPDELVRSRGLDAFRAVLAKRAPGAKFRGLVLLEGIMPTSPDFDRRQAVERVLSLHDSLRGPSAGLDQTDLLNLLAERTGYPCAVLAEQAERLKDRRRREELERETKQAVREAQAGLEQGKAAQAVVDRLAERLSALRARTVDVPPPFSVDRLERESAALPEGKSLGWRAVDALDVGLYPGELAVLAGRTGHGKTTVMVNLFANLVRDAVGREADEVFVLYSAEEPEIRIYHRLLALVAAVEVGTPWTVNEVRDFLLGRDRPRSYPDPKTLEAARAILRSWEDRIIVAHRPLWTVAEIEADAHRLAAGRAVGAVLVDYLQRVYPPKDFGKGRRRDEEVSVVARRLKTLAESLSAPVVAGAQINRKAVDEAKKIPLEGNYGDKKVMEALKARRPQLHHLREGGSEQEADLVLGLMNYAADFAEDSEKESVPPVTRLEIGTLKNRYGAPGRWASLALEGRHGRIRDQHNNDWI